MAYYKIVAVLKRRKTTTVMEYSYIPHKWESDGVLKWPKKSILHLQDDLESIPQVDCDTYNCKVKKDLIFGLPEAQLWEEEYVNASNTEAEESLTIDQKRQQSKRQRQSNETADLQVVGTSYDNLFSEITHRSQLPSTSTVPIIVSTDDGVFLPGPVSEQNASVGQENFVTLDLVPSSNGVDQQFITSINEKLNGLIETVKRLENIIKSDHLQVTVMQERILALIDKQFGIVSSAQSVREDEDPRREFASKFSLPLDTVDAISEFNKELRDNTKYMTSSYNSIAGTSGTEEGKIVLKKLLEIFFTKSILMEYSWTGISRTPGLSKKNSFQSLEVILKFFFDIVSAADSRWTKSKTEVFFKVNILKHARQANAAFEKKRKCPSIISITSEEDINDVTVEENEGQLLQVIDEESNLADKQ
ncbi:hypothetical protein FQR65_LT18003 [Abscondita terminalis]|nr:hypothetical protein FQR65_LT18003 [Abscondita terminalis]